MKFNPLGDVLNNDSTSRQEAVPEVYFKSSHTRTHLIRNAWIVCRQGKIWWVCELILPIIQNIFWNGVTWQGRMRPKTCVGSHGCRLEEPRLRGPRVGSKFLITFSGHRLSLEGHPRPPLALLECVKNQLLSSDNRRNCYKARAFPAKKPCRHICVILAKAEQSPESWLPRRKTPRNGSPSAVSQLAPGRSRI